MDLSPQTAPGAKAIGDVFVNYSFSIILEMTITAFLAALQIT